MATKKTTTKTTTAKKTTAKKPVATKKPVAAKKPAAKNSSSKTTKPSKKKGFKMPTTLTILLGVLFGAVLLTWMAPASFYAGSDGIWTSVGAAPLGIVDYFMAIGEGFMSSAGLIFFLFGIGAFMNVVIKSKSMEAAVGGLLKKTKGKEIMIIPILMIFFAAGGTVYGMAEETLVFYAILVPVFLLAGFDSLTAVFTILLGAGVGVAASTVNPFAIGAAMDAIPGVTTSLGDGMMFRFISVAIFASLAISFVMIRAKKIQQGKWQNEMADLDPALLKSAEKEFDLANMPEFTTRRKWVLAALLGALVWMVFALVPWDMLGVTVFENMHFSIIEWVPWFNSGTFGNTAIGWWYFVELGVFFFVLAYIFGFVAGFKEKEVPSIMFEGASDMMGVAMVIAVARGVSIVLGGTEVALELILIEGSEGATGTYIVEAAAHNGRWIKTLVEGNLTQIEAAGFEVFSESLNGLPTEFFIAESVNVGLTNSILELAAEGMQDMSAIGFNTTAYILYIPLAFLIPSTSGLAGATMGVMGPLAEQMEAGNAAGVVTSFSFASGIVNLVTPTSGVVMGGLAIAKVPYERYLKAVWKFVLAFFVVSLLLIVFGSIGSNGGFIAR